MMNADGLQQLTQKLRETQAQQRVAGSPVHQAPSSEVSTCSTELRYSKFTIGGLPGEKHAVFIPDNLRLTLPVLEQVCAALAREMPSMLLCGVSSLCHPAKLSTPELLKCKGLQHLMEDTRNSLSPTAQPKDGHSSCCKGSQDTSNEVVIQANATESKSKQLVDVADRVLEKKIASGIRSIAKAAQQTNIWTFTGPQISNFELYLQQGMLAGEADVFRMAVAHLQDKAWMEAEVPRSMLRHLFDRSQAMSQDQVTNSRPVQLQGDFWNQVKNTAHREFAEHGHEFWSFDSYDDPMAHGHPITQFPWPHANLVFLFYHEARDGHSSLPDADWNFSTKQRFDTAAVPFSPEMLAPVGYVFIGTKKSKMKKRMLQAIYEGRPVIMVDNTPNLIKQMSLLVSALQKVFSRSSGGVQQFLRDDVSLGRNASTLEILEALKPSSLMQHIEEHFDVSGMEESERLNLSDIVGLIDFTKRRPQIIRDNVSIVDPLNTHPETIVKQAIHVMNIDFSNSSSARGHATVTQRSLVLHGWRLHHRLMLRANQLRGQVILLVVGYATAMVLSTILAICSIYLQTQQERYGKDAMYNASVPVNEEVIVMRFSLGDESKFLRLLILALPMAVGIFIALLSHLQVQQKWSAVRMAACKTESEIYMLLGSVGPYSGGASTMHKKFMRRLTELLKYLSMSGFNEEVVDGAIDAHWPEDNGELEQYINQYVYGIPPMSCAFRCLLCCGEALRLISPCCSCNGNDVEADAIDPIAPLTTDSYMQVRVQPLRRYYSKQGAQIMLTRLVLLGFLVACLSLCSGLSAFGFSVCVPTTLAVAAFFTTVIQWMVPAHVLNALNCANNTLTNLDLRWKGTEAFQNNAMSSKTRLIQTTEKVNWAVCATLTGAFTLSDDFDANDNDEDPLSRDLSRHSTSNSKLTPRSTSRTGSGRTTPNYYGRSRCQSGNITPRM
mmetsp:Transcript_3508/g.6715  ORF Transcript_3508/g.6715 Transcript_3508/m.6715 type:complete len:949 (+) Transcript_3508:52-2898(+)|eukprot:CAMPEP_0172808066 /NCGR_PEP_ID=MMETSP1075-20121228/7426_1 /TAXON_ID=2916 /ORGANISM="Ceratium fusus, Strain PA161109" /LENGTH=948 /DNA_ID=CAMNT_0013647143 /DNA_START=13 /DNA_END=2859 /DNA_ORIENTATION=-